MNHRDYHSNEPLLLYTTPPPPFSMNSPHPAGGSGEAGILRRGSPAGSSAQLPGCFPTCPQRLSLCHPGRTPGASSMATTGLPLVTAARPPAVSCALDMALVTKQPGLREEDISELGVQPPLSSALQRPVRPRERLPVKTKQGWDFSSGKHLLVFDACLNTVWCGLLENEFPWF